MCRNFNRGDGRIKRPNKKRIALLPQKNPTMVRAKLLKSHNGMKINNRSFSDIACSSSEIATPTQASLCTYSVEYANYPHDLNANRSKQKVNTPDLREALEGWSNVLLLKSRTCRMKFASRRGVFITPRLTMPVQFLQTSCKLLTGRPKYCRVIIFVQASDKDFQKFNKV